MDLIYKIYSVYLYDNQLDHDFLILNNRSKRYQGVTWDLPYDFSGMSSTGALGQIYNMKGKNRKEESISVMREVSEDNSLPFIKNDGFLTLVKTKVLSDFEGGMKDSRYNIYDIFWNETKSGINIHEFEVLHIWSPGESSYSSYRIWEEKHEREIQIRDFKLQEILQK